MRLFSRKRKISRRTQTVTPKKMLLRQILVGLGLVLFFTALGYGIWFGTRVESLTINEVEVLGGETIPREMIRLEVEKLLEGAYFRLVPRRFAWTYPHDEIVAKVAELERVKQVHAERSKRKLVVAFEEYRPIALWCAQVSDKDCLFLDKEGLAFAKAPWLEGAAFMRYSEPGREPTVGLEAFSGEFIEDTNTFVENAYYQLGLNITHVEKIADDEIDYHVSGGGLIKVSSRISTQETLENLEAILTSAEFEHLEPGNFKYIDLRYGDKIFINEELEELETESATSSEARADEV